jgi:hypothetical protein
VVVQESFGFLQRNGKRAREVSINYVNVEGQETIVIVWPEANNVFLEAQ